ncbi:MAG: hypothetical protein ACRDQ4_24360 [Pseudonocardiaceae bacterium]
MRAVLDQTNAISQHHRTNPGVMSQVECDLWTTLDVLREAYDRECGDQANHRRDSLRTDAILDW